MDSGIFNLDWLIAPISKSDFLQKYWENKVLVVNRYNENYWGNILTIGQIDEALCSFNFKLGEVRVEKFNTKLNPKDYLFGIERVDVSKVLNLFKNGHTIIINNLNHRLRSLALLTTAMEHEMSMPFQANIYLTPENAQGFRAHYDDHCVFILQIFGSKRWRIYEREVVNPTAVFSPEIEINEQKTISQEFTLNPGDIAYVPRGFVHDASSFEGGGSSLHITLGVQSYSWGDFFAHYLRILETNNSSLRKSIPIGFARAGFNSENLLSEMNRILKEIKWEKWKDETLSSFVEQFIFSKQPMRHGSLERLARNHTVNTKTNLSRRPYALYQIIETLEYIHIKSRSNQSIFPSNFKDVIQFALSSENFTIKDLPGGQDLETKMKIIQELIDDSWVIIKE